MLVVPESNWDTPRPEKTFTAQIHLPYVRDTAVRDLEANVKALEDELRECENERFTQAKELNYLRLPATAKMALWLDEWWRRLF